MARLLPICKFDLFTLPGRFSLTVARTMDRPGFEADRLHITLFNRIKQTNRRICDSWDRSPDGTC